MSIFQKKLSTKKFSMQEMWEIYKNIDPVIPHKKYVIDEVSVILDRISTHKFKEVLHILFPNKLATNGLEAGLLFTKGLVDSKFFEFQSFVEELRGRSE